MLFQMLVPMLLLSITSTKQSASLLESVKLELDKSLSEQTMNHNCVAQQLHHPMIKYKSKMRNTSNIKKKTVQIVGI